MAHHVLTMLLIFLAYLSNLIRYGTMWLTLFDLRCEHVLVNVCEACA